MLITEPPAAQAVNQGNAGAAAEAIAQGAAQGGSAAAAQSQALAQALGSGGATAQAVAQATALAYAQQPAPVTNALAEAIKAANGNATQVCACGDALGLPSCAAERGWLSWAQPSLSSSSRARPAWRPCQFGALASGRLVAVCIGRCRKWLYVLQQPETNPTTPAPAFFKANLIEPHRHAHPRPPRQPSSSPARCQTAVTAPKSSSPRCPMPSRPVAARLLTTSCPVRGRRAIAFRCETMACLPFHAPFSRCTRRAPASS